MSRSTSFELSIAIFWNRFLDLGSVDSRTWGREVPFAIIVRGDQEDGVDMWEHCDHKVRGNAKESIVGAHDVWIAGLVWMEQRQWYLLRLSVSIARRDPRNRQLPGVLEQRCACEVHPKQVENFSQGRSR